MEHGFKMMAPSVEDEFSKKPIPPKSEVKEHGSSEDIEHEQARARAAEPKKDIADILHGREEEDLSVDELNRVLELWKGIRDIGLAVEEKSIASLESSSESKLEGPIWKQMEKAREILGDKEVFGPKEVMRSFGVTIEAKDIPTIPFDEKELQRAKELGQFLILRVNVAPDGTPLTMPKMHELAKKKGVTALYSTDDEWKLKSDFYSKKTPSLGWALVSAECIPKTKNENYYEQTRLTADYLKDEVYKGYTDTERPKKLNDALKQFKEYTERNFKDKEKDEIHALLRGDDWKKYAKELSELAINQSYTPKAVDVMFDMIVRKVILGEYFHKADYIRTNDIVSDTSSDDAGGVVYVGRFADEGAYVISSTPDDKDGNLGFGLSR